VIDSSSPVEQVWRQDSNNPSKFNSFDLQFVRIDERSRM